MRLATSLALLASLAAVAAACGSAQAPAPPVVAVPPAPAPSGPRKVSAKLADVGLDASALDRTADACGDFYQFACGGWLAHTEIPADKSRWTRSFSEIYERNEQTLRDILERAAAEPAPDAVTRQIGDFWSACMDEAAVEKAGAKPLAPLLALVGKVRDVRSLSAAVAALHRRKIWALFDVSGEQDFGDATRVIAQLDQNGLGLPDRDYYVRDDDKAKELRATYVGHVERMLGLAGLGPAEAKLATDDVMRLETALAKAQKTRVERRDPKSLYNKVDRAGVEKAAPALDWSAWFTALGLAGVTDVNVTSVSYLEAVSALMRAEKPAAWRHYLAWHVVRAEAPSLSGAFVDEAFTLERALTGQKEQQARWKRCVSATDHALGEALAQPFVKERFGGASKPAADRMVAEISAAFAHELDGLAWMDAPTRARAASKLTHMAYLVGYPASWRAYDFAVGRTAHADNVRAARAFDLAHTLSRIGKPVDRGEWQMTPPTVNAYYDPQKNQMVFPAGILQPPFFSEKASVPVNLGGIGMVVGHELTHGFDDEGSQFDGAGNLKNWWEPAVSNAFEGKTSCVERQYGAYETLPGVKLNGKLTLGENLADGGGVLLAFEAYRRLRASATEVQVAEGFSEDQQFFLAVGQAWCTKSRDEWARMAAQVDPHSPPRFRVNGSLANVPAFGEAFACPKGAPMAPASACQVW